MLYFPLQLRISRGSRRINFFYNFWESRKGNPIFIVNKLYAYRIYVRLEEEGDLAGTFIGTEKKNDVDGLSV